MDLTVIDTVSAVASEFIKCRRRPAIWIVGACWTAQIVLFAYLVPFLILQTVPSTSTTATRTLLLGKLLPGNVDLTTAASFPIFGGAVMLILGVLLVGFAGIVVRLGLLQVRDASALETLELVHQIDALLPCILVTADANEMLIREAFRAHAYSVIPKPVSKNVVLYTVVRALMRVYGNPRGFETID